MAKTLFCCFAVLYCEPGFTMYIYNLHMVAFNGMERLNKVKLSCINLLGHLKHSSSS